MECNAVSSKTSFGIVCTSTVILTSLTLFTNWILLLNLSSVTEYLLFYLSLVLGSTLGIWLDSLLRKCMIVLSIMTFELLSYVLRCLMPQSLLK